MAGSTSGTPAPLALSLQQSTRGFQRRLLLETLAASGWNVVDAAQRLDVARSHFYVMMRAFGISRPE